jgi:hypothetical protein
MVEPKICNTVGIALSGQGDLLRGITIAEQTVGTDDNRRQVGFRQMKHAF